MLYEDDKYQSYKSSLEPNTGNNKEPSSYPGLGVVAPTRQTSAARSEKKKMRNTPTPNPMTRVSPFSVKPSAAIAAEDMLLYVRYLRQYVLAVARNTRYFSRCWGAAAVISPTISTRCVDALPSESSNLPGDLSGRVPR